MGTSVKELLEAATHIKPKTHARLLEMGPDMGGAYTAPQEAAPAAPADPAAAAIAPPEENARDTLAKALMLLLKSGDGADHKLAIQLMKILKPQGSGSAMGEAPPELDGLEEDDEAAEGDTPPPKKKEPPMEESRRKAAPVAAVLTESDARGLCDLAGVKASAPVLGLMTGKTLQEARAVIDLARGTPARSNAPRSSGAASRPLQESKAPLAEQYKAVLR